VEDLAPEPEPEVEPVEAVADEAETGDGETGDSILNT
jgi:hypothetical protein